MKYLFLIAVLWFALFEACHKETNEATPNTAKAEKVALNTPEKSHLETTFDSLSNELCCRVYFSEQQLNKLKKKRWPNSERLTIQPIRAIDPVYCNSKSNNPPE